MENTVKIFEQITPNIILEWKSERDIVIHVSSPIMGVKLSAYLDDTLDQKVLNRMYGLAGVNCVKIDFYTIEVNIGLFFTFGAREDEKSLLNKLIDIAIEAVEISKKPPY
ncbi:MAG: hypothetical protein ACOX6Q_01800 [Candidatus Dojkabacteria bacterium]|jgi:hypothetical protein